MFQKRKRPVSAVAIDEPAINKLLDNYDSCRAEVGPELPMSPLPQAPCCEWCLTTDKPLLTDCGIVCSSCYAVDRDRLAASVEDGGLLFNNGFSTRHKVPYQRILYFREFIRQRQGLENVRIPNTVLKVVKDQLLVAEEEACRKLLLANGLGYFGEHAPLLLKTLYGKLYKPLRLSLYQEQVLMEEYTTLEKRFQTLKSTKQLTGRKSMLSLSFICYMISEAHGWLDTLKYWRVSKRQDTLMQHMLTYKRLICA